MEDTEIKNNELFNIEAEQIVLGSIIMYNEYLNRIVDLILPNHFYEQIHKKIYEQILFLINDRNVTANSTTLKAFFNNSDIFNVVGGSAYINTLQSMATGIIDIKNYAIEIRELAIRRELYTLGGEITIDSRQFDNKKTAMEILNEFESKIFKIAEHGEKTSGLQQITPALTKSIDNMVLATRNINNISGLPTGFRELDWKLGGLHNSDLIIIAGRPSMGKTAFAINIALNSCKHLQDEYIDNLSKENKKQKSVGIFSLEMSSEQICKRLLSLKTGLNSKVFDSGKIKEGSSYRNINDYEFTEIVRNSEELQKMKIFIDDTSQISIQEMRFKIRKLIRKENLSMIVVDYLQLMVDKSKRYQNNRVQEITEITQGLKAIAKEFNIPVVALSQLSRAVETREDKMPQLSDLRESGSIEQDADIVIFLYREEYYEARKEPTNPDNDKHNKWKEKMNEIKNKATIMIAKHRNGPIGSVELKFEPECTKFSNLNNN